MADMNDPRSTVGRYMRGNNIYGAGGTSPNPTGTNQYPKNLQQAAALRRKKNRMMQTRNNAITDPSLLGGVGGLYA